MESTRQKKVSRLLEKELGNIFQKKGREYNGKMISVTKVRITPDLGLAKVYLSVFPPQKTGEESVMELIKTQSSHIRYEVGKLVGKQLRIVPELSFFIDDSLDYINNIEDLLKK
ncbi:MAG: 30S ribosome-binding factor RbfA [Bacteroidales bacterium]|nr:30S ribosome-binding factor RbfA [Bacteroidales bacterium]MCF8389232.1 30S ribosome-binding factor RbfA [Bacteroidales bacterium]